MTTERGPESPYGSAAPYYVRFRPRYPVALLDELAARCGLDGRGRLLDLGCGPGFVAVALASRVEEAVGMDPEPEMLDRAGAEASAAGVRLTLVRGSSADLGPWLGRFRLVTMGRSFHWMDRAATLLALDPLVLPGGAVAILAEHHTGRAENRWKPAWDAVVEEFGGGARAAHPRRLHPQWKDHEVVLRRSPFAAVERFAVAQTRRTPLEGLIGRAYSMSSTAPSVLGDRRAAFETALRAALQPFVDDGAVAESVDFHVLLARRPTLARGESLRSPSRLKK